LGGAARNGAPADPVRDDCAHREKRRRPGTRGDSSKRPARRAAPAARSDAHASELKLACCPMGVAARHAGPMPGADRQNCLTMPAPSSYFDGVAGDLAEGRRLMDAAAGTDPETGLPAVVALRQLVEVLEELQVDRARQQGWSWRDIALRLGVTNPAVHYTHGLRIPRSQRAPRW